MIDVTDSQSDATRNPGFRQGTRIGSMRDGLVKFLTPALGPETKPTSVTEGVVADASGNVYGAETSTTNVRIRQEVRIREQKRYQLPS
jgi:hypothetical protein